MLVTGVSSYLGGKVATALAAHPSAPAVIGMDVVPPHASMGGARFVRADIRSPAIARLLRDEAVDTVVHMNVIATPRSAGGRVPMKEINVIGTMQLLAALQKVPDVRRLVVKSTAGRLRRRAGRPRDLHRGHLRRRPRRAPAGPRTASRSRATSAASPAAARTSPSPLLRFASIVGPGLETPLSRAFALPVVPGLLGHDGRLQFVHEEDAVEAMVTATLARGEDDRGATVTGAVNVAGDGVLTTSQAAAMAGPPRARPARAAGPRREPLAHPPRRGRAVVRGPAPARLRPRARHHPLPRGDGLRARPHHPRGVLGLPRGAPAARPAPGRRPRGRGGRQGRGRHRGGPPVTGAPPRRRVARAPTAPPPSGRAARGTPLVTPAPAVRPPGRRGRPRRRRTRRCGPDERARVVDLVAQEAGERMAEAMAVPRRPPPGGRPRPRRGVARPGRGRTGRAGRGRAARRGPARDPAAARRGAATPPPPGTPEADRATGAGEAEEGVDDPAHLAELLLDAVEFVRRRLEGDYAVDEFGFDPELTERVLLNVLRPVYRRWFRVELRGADRIPADRGALLVGNHSGTLAWDALMTQVAVHDSTGGRFLRLLGADLVFATPVIGDVARRMGATLAASSDAERLLSVRRSSSGCGPRGSRGSARTTATGTGSSASAAAGSSRRPSAPRSRSSR